MKKQLLATLITASFASAALAQSNVTIYGVVDTGINYSKTGGGSDSSSWGMGSLQSGSRIGFKGTEDLGGGTKAIFTLENGFNTSDGSLGQSTDKTREFGRQAFVGLSGDWGTYKMGRQYNPIRTALESVSPFEIGLAGNILTIFDAHGERSDNMANYTLPNMHGFSGQVAYSLGKDPSTTGSVGKQWGFSTNYTRGPANVVLAYHHSDLTSSTTPYTDNGNKKTTMLGGTYDFGMVKAHAAYAWNKGENLSGVDNLDTRDMMVGVTVPVNSVSRVLASYMRKDNKLTSNADTNIWSIGYTYDLSKRTNLYASYAKLTNDAAAKLAIKDAVGTINNDYDPSTINFGIRHKF